MFDKQTNRDQLFEKQRHMVWIGVRWATHSNCLTMKMFWGFPTTTQQLPFFLVAAEKMHLSMAVIKNSCINHLTVDLSSPHEHGKAHV